MNAHAGKAQAHFQKQPAAHTTAIHSPSSGVNGSNAQGKFWPMLELPLTQKPLPQKDQLAALAATQHLDVAKFRTDMGLEAIWK
jgi:hypothetical protein